MTDPDGDARIKEVQLELDFAHARNNELRVRVKDVIESANEVQQRLVEQQKGSAQEQLELQKAGHDAAMQEKQRCLAETLAKLEQAEARHAGDEDKRVQRSGEIARAKFELDRLERQHYSRGSH